MSFSMSLLNQMTMTGLLCDQHIPSEDEMILEEDALFKRRERKTRSQSRSFQDKKKCARRSLQEEVSKEVLYDLSCAS